MNKLFATAALVLFSAAAATPAAASVEAVMANDANVKQMVESIESCAKDNEKAKACLEHAKAIHSHCSGVHIGDKDNKLGCSEMFKQNLEACAAGCAE